MDKRLGYMEREPVALRVERGTVRFTHRLMSGGDVTAQVDVIAAVAPALSVLAITRLASS